MIKSMLLGLTFCFCFIVSSVSQTSAAVSFLLNVSYDPTREFYKEFNAAFEKHWKAKTGETIKIRMSHGGSGEQARAVVSGLKASVVTLALAFDIDNIAKLTKKLPLDWQKRLPFNSSPYTSTVVFLVRKDNPKKIKDWGDLVNPDVKIVTPNPKTSGGARWTYLAAWAYAAKEFEGSEKKIREFMGKLYRNAPVLDAGARGSAMTFAHRGIGDVLLTWENEAYLLLKQIPDEGFELIFPSISILAEPPVAVIDANVDEQGARVQAEAYVDYLYSKEGQALAAKYFYRPQKPEYAAAEDIARFKKLNMVNIDETFGGWKKVQHIHFSDGGTFDLIYKPQE